MEECNDIDKNDIEICMRDGISYMYSPIHDLYYIRWFDDIDRKMYCEAKTSNEMEELLKKIEDPDEDEMDLILTYFPEIYNNM